MAYSLEIILAEMEVLAEEYIRYVASATPMGIRKLRGAYRNEFCCDAAVVHHIADDNRKEVCEGVISHMEVSKAEGRIYLNSTRTHWYEFKELIEYWTDRSPSKQMVDAYEAI